MGDSPTSALGTLASTLLQRASAVTKKDSPTPVTTPVVTPEVTTDDDKNQVAGHARANAKTNRVGGMADQVRNKSPEAKALRKDLTELCQQLQQEPGFATDPILRADVARLMAVSGKQDLDDQSGRVEAYKQLLTTCATHRDAMSPDVKALARKIATNLEGLQAKEGRKATEGNSGRQTLHSLLFANKEVADASQASMAHFNQTLSADQVRIFYKVASELSSRGIDKLAKNLELLFGPSGQAMQSTLTAMTSSLTSKGYVSDGKGGMIHPTTHLPPSDAEVLEAFEMVETHAENRHNASWSNFNDVLNKNKDILSPDQKNGVDFWKSIDVRNIETIKAPGGGTMTNLPLRLSHEVYDLMTEMGLGTAMFKDGDAWLKKAMSPSGIKLSELLPDQANFLKALQAKHPNMVKIEGAVVTVTTNADEGKELNSFIAGMNLVSVDDGSAFSQAIREAYAEVEISTRHLRDLNGLKAFFENALVDPNKLGFDDLLPETATDREGVAAETTGWVPPDVPDDPFTATTILTTTDPGQATTGNVAKGFVPTHEDAEDIRVQGQQQQQTLNRLWDDLDRDFKRTIEAMDA
jgi:hypothetical protein